VTIILGGDSFTQKDPETNQWSPRRRAPPARVRHVQWRSINKNEKKKLLLRIIRVSWIIQFWNLSLLASFCAKIFADVSYTVWTYRYDWNSSSSTTFPFSLQLFTLLSYCSNMLMPITTKYLVCREIRHIFILHYISIPRNDTFLIKGMTISSFSGSLPFSLANIFSRLNINSSFIVFFFQA